MPVKGEKKLSTGVAGLDALLGGGIPEGAGVLALGHPLSGKKPLAMSFLFQGLAEGKPGVLVLTDHDYGDWKKMMGWSGWQLEQFEKKGLVAVVNAPANAMPHSEGFVFRPENPAALNSLSIAISRAVSSLAGKGAPVVVFHCISTLLEKNDSPTVYRFMEFISSKFKAVNATVFYALDSGMASEKDTLMIEHLMDGVIEVEENRLRVRGFIDARSNEWSRFSTSEGKLRLGSREKQGGKKRSSPKQKRKRVKSTPKRFKIRKRMRSLPKQGKKRKSPQGLLKGRKRKKA